MRILRSLIPLMIWALCFYCWILSTKAVANNIDHSNSVLDDYKQSVAMDLAHCYGLSREQAILLFAIRDHEDGEKAKKEFGIEGKEKIDDPIRRYANHACYSANAIKRFCPDTKRETIKRFNHGYGVGEKRYRGYAEDRDWYKFVIRRMKEYENIFY
jgi:hypothetical protein